MYNILHNDKYKFVIKHGLFNTIFWGRESALIFITEPFSILNVRFSLRSLKRTFINIYECRCGEVFFLAVCELTIFINYKKFIDTIIKKKKKKTFH